MTSSDPRVPLPGSRPNKPFDIFGFVYRYGLLIVTGGLFLLTMLVPLVLKVKQPNYETHSMLKIDPVIPSLITKSEDPSITGFYHDFVRTQAARISEFEVMAEAIGQLSEAEKATLFPKGMDTEECVALLQRIITISPVSRTHLVKLSIQGAQKEGLAPMLNALMTTYLAKMQVELEQKNMRRLSYLNDKKSALQTDILAKEGQLQQVATTVLSSTFSEGYNIWQKRVEDLQKSYVRFFGDRVRAENEFVYEQKTADELKELPLVSLIDEGVMNDRAIDFTSSWTYQQLQDMRSSIDGVTEENYDRKLVEQRMTAMREYEDKLRRETRDNISNVIHGKRDLELKQSLIKKENKLLEAQASEQDFREALAEAKEMSGRNSSALLKGTSLETELEHARDLLFRIDTRIHELEAESRAPLRVTIESAAKEPLQPAGSNIKKLLMFCVAASFGSVGGAFLLLEFFDNRIRSPKHIADALGHPPTWPISRSPAGVLFENVLSDGSQSAAAKSIRSLATRLYREHEENGARIFLFTAVDPRSGTTGIVFNCAQALAYQSAKVLVIDTNLQDWEMSAEQAAEWGEEHDIDPLEAIQHDSKRGIDYLVSFMPRKSTRHTSRLLNRFLEEVRSEYDFICIDSSPVLQCDMTEYLAIHSDAAVLIVQGDSAIYRDVRHSAEILVRLDIPALAPVLNWGGVRTRPLYEKCIDAIPGMLRRSQFGGQDETKMLEIPAKS